MDFEYHRGAHCSVTTFIGIPHMYARGERALPYFCFLSLFWLAENNAIPVSAERGRVNIWGSFVLRPQAAGAMDVLVDSWGDFKELKIYFYFLR